jgi:hypothetical protein
MDWLTVWYRSLSTAQKFVVVSLLTLFLIYGAVFSLIELTKSPQSRAIATCVQESIAASPGSNTTEAEERCQVECAQGKLEPCRPPNF